MRHKLQEVFSRLRKIHYLGIFVFALIASLIYALFFDPITTTFNVTANTEWMEIKITGNKEGRINLENVDIYSDSSSPRENFSGQFRISKGTIVTAERIGYGHLTLRMLGDSGHSCGTLLTESDQLVEHAGDDLEIWINDIGKRAIDGETVLLPIDGAVNIGRVVKEESVGASSALLRGGQVSVTGYSLLSDRFDAGTTPLLLGDVIRFIDPQNQAFGFITVNENSGIEIAYRVIASDVIISKSGPQDPTGGIAVHATRVDRLLKASTYQLVSLIFGAIVVLITITSFFLEHGTSKLAKFFR